MGDDWRKEELLKKIEILARRGGRYPLLSDVSERTFECLSEIKEILAIIATFLITKSNKE
jgi:hypothetical protein